MTLAVDIKANIRGSESLSKLANDIRDVQKVSGDLSKSRFTYFDTLKRDAEAYSSNLKDQIRYVREQIGLDRQRATEGHRQRMLGLQGNTLRRSKEVRSHLEMGSESTGAREELVDWIRSQGIGMSSKSPGMFGTVAGGFAQGGVAGGTRGMLGSMASRARGMGLVKGGGIALGAYAGYKVVSGLSQGFGELKSLEQSLVNIYGLMKKMPEDTSRFRKDIQLAALASGIMGKDFTAISASWMTLANAPSPNLKLLKGDIRTGRAYGISPDFSATYGARLARLGYWNLPDKIPSGILGAGIKARQMAGLSEARSQEFLELIQSVTGTVASTAGAANIPRAMAIAANVAKLGEPFQGARGAQFISGLHSGLTRGDDYGVTYLAAQRALFKKTGKRPSYGDVEMFRAGGLDEPELLREVFGLTKSIFRDADENTLAVMLAKSLNSKDYRRFKTMLPMLEEKGGLTSGEGLIAGEMTKPDFMKKFKELGGFKLPPGQASLMEGMPPLPERDQRINKIEETFGFASTKAEIAIQIGKIEASAALFEKGADVFYRGVDKLVEALLSASPDGMSETERGLLGVEMMFKLGQYGRGVKHQGHSVDQ